MSRRGNWTRAAIGAGIALLVIAVVPNWQARRDQASTQEQPLHGVIDGGDLVYHDATLAMAMEDVSQLAGIRLVARPELAARRFSGRLPRSPKTALARALARASGCRLVAAGPHWALVE